jgi:DedD protein
VPAVGKPPATASAPAPKAAPSAAEKKAAKAEPEAARAKALLEGKEAWVVRLGAFSNRDNVVKLREKLTAAGVRSYTEAVAGPKGEQTRVRAGPFESKLEAEQAQNKLTAAGVSPGTVGQR